MNSMLDPSVYVNNVKVVNDEFHARFDVKKKVYRYDINLGEYNPIIDSYIYNYNRPLNISAMKKASKYLLGINSYEALTSGERENYNSIIYKIVFTKKKDILSIKFEGKAFYRYMVRNLVGALMQVGEGKQPPEYIKELIDKKKHNKKYVTVPANGLYLMKVDY
jgi:tRNA pseudouridine38-40 synthase